MGFSGGSSRGTRRWSKAQVLRLEYGKLKQPLESLSAVAKVAGKRSRRAKSAAPALSKTIRPTVRIVPSKKCWVIH